MAALELHPLPPKEAIAYFKAKGHALAPSFAWQDVWQQTHTTAFTVAKSAGFDILKDIHDAVQKAQKDGLPFADFEKRLTPVLQDKGWWGRQAVTDPKTGETMMAQLGSARRLRIIYDVNMRMNNAVGRWSQIQRVKGARPFLRYVAVLDRRTRPSHRMWHGTVLPADHPFWDTHFPPNGWRCRCTIQQLSQADLDDFGYQESAPPVIETKPWVNPRTDKIIHVPDGIDPGFAYNPGKAALDGHAARALNSKLIDAPPALAAEASAASARFVAPALERDFKSWCDELAAQMEGKAVRPTGERRVLGALDKTVLAKLEVEGLVPASGAITASDGDILHMLRDAKTKAGKAPGVDLVKALPATLAKPDAILWDKQKRNFLYVASGEAKDVKFVVVINRSEKLPATGPSPRQKVTTNSVISSSLVERHILTDANSYELIEGDL